LEVGLSALVPKRKQRLDDLAADTLVVSAR
jgi:uncharacterized RDD family membrane protein YckC